MGNKWMCGSVDVAMGKRQIKSADVKCGCVYITSHESC